MGRKVKCQITKESGDSTEFFKAPNGKYYKTEEVYNQWRRNTQDRAKCIGIICEYGGYKNGTMAPTYMNKMISDFGNKVGYDVLLETLEECRDAFEWANMNREFNSEVQRLFYYKSIIGNKVIDVYKRVQLIKEQERKMDATSFEDMGDLEMVGCPTGGGKDLRNLLGDI